MSLLEIEGLSFRPPSASLFSSGPAGREILVDIALSLREGEIAGLIGESGSGKTTLVRCIAGLVQPSSGSIRFQGRPIYPGGNRRSFPGTQIQMVFQSGSLSLDPCMTVLSSLAEAIEAAGNSKVDVRDRAEQLLSAVGLSADLLLRYPRGLSTGQRQRVALARALAVGAKLLLLDEPTSGLDAISQVHTLALIATLCKQEGMSILFVSHDIAAAFAICSRISVMHDGKVIDSGTPRGLIESAEGSQTGRLLMGAGLTK